MEGWRDQLFETEELINKIVDLLPEDDPITAFTSLSMAIDKYSSKIGKDSKECWDACYKTAKAVHEEYGSYKEES